MVLFKNINNYGPTIGVDFKTKTIDVDGKRIKLQIWDTAGQERFRNITKTYYKGSKGIILTYSVTDRQSFENVENSIRVIFLINFSQQKKLLMRLFFLILVSNKCDISAAERSVHPSEGTSLANQYNIPFFEVSAKENLHIMDVFQTLGLGINKILVKEGNYKDKNT